MLHPAGSTPLDEFLAGGGSTDDAERLARVGLLGSLTGLVLAVGLLVFLAVVHRGRAGEIRVLLRVAGAAGVVVVVGACVEVAGVASLLDVPWSEALTTDAGSAAMMRLLAGSLLVLGLFDHTVPVGGPSELLLESLDEPDPGSVTGSDPEPNGPVRWVPSHASAFGLAGATIGVFSFGFDGHTVTEGPRLAHAALDLVHVAAGATWFGGVAGLLVVGVLRHRDGGRVGPLIVRFSSVATVALAAVAVAGIAMSLMIVDGVGDYTGTAWGRTLLVKLAAVAVAAAVGAYHHFVVVPALARSPGDAAAERRARTTIRVEAIVLAAVVVTTVFLVGASAT